MSNADNVAGLNHFEISAAGETGKGQTVEIYSNGRQQYQVDIIIEAVDKNGHVINLSEDDMKTVILMDYNSEKGFEDTFGRSYTWAGYDLPGPRSQETSPTPDAAKSTLRFYEHVMPSTHGTLKIAAKITLGGVTYKTNGTEAEPGGKVVNGKSNSYFHLTALTPQRFYADSFVTVKVGAIGYGYEYPDEAPNFDRWFVLWKIRFIDTSRGIYDSSVSGSTTNWFSQWDGGPKKRRHWLLPVHRQTNKKAILGWNRKGTSSHDCFMYPYSGDAVAYAVIEESTRFEGNEYNATGVTFYDNYGNAHPVILRPNNNGTTFQIDDN